MAKVRKQGPDGKIRWVDPVGTAPKVRMPVRVKLPAALHPSQPTGIGIVTDVVDGTALVLVYPTRHLSMQTITVPHRSCGDVKKGWWELDDAY